MSTYKLDPNKSFPENLIVNESRVLTAPTIEQDAGFIIPEFAPFHADSVIVRSTPNGDPLIEGKDYWLSHEFIEANIAFNGEFRGGIVFSDRTLSGTVYITYHTLGGDFTNDARTTLESLTRQYNGINEVTWGIITGVPNAFPTFHHDHDGSEDFPGYDDLILAVDRLGNILGNLPVDASTELIRLMLNNHLSSTNTTAHTPAQVGLSNVQNLPMATLEQASKAINEAYASPAIVNYMIDLFLKGDGFDPAAVLKTTYDEATTDNIYYSAESPLPDESVFLLKDIELSEEIGFDPISKIVTNKSVSNDVYLCFQSFGVSSSAESPPGELNRRFILAVGLNNTKKWSYFSNSDINGDTDFAWKKLSSARDVNLERLRNISYVDYRDWEELKDPVPEEESIDNEKYITLSAMRKMIAELKSEIEEVKEVYKVGDIYITERNFTSASAVSSALGYGTWQAHGKGKVLVGQDKDNESELTDESWVKTLGNTYGSFRKVLSEAEMPEHRHYVLWKNEGPNASTSRLSFSGNEDKALKSSATSGSSDSEYSLSPAPLDTLDANAGLSSSSGSGQAFSLAQPSIVVGVWKRIT